ncbi:MAG TPA: hypothetical protein VHD35_00220 [Chitinophagaceae bacterium]|nr:hypothetical protein [Chitinophagaceae bacterium]
MKPGFIFLLLQVTSMSFASAQKAPVVNMYAYTQTVLPGQKKIVIPDENGNTIEPAMQKKMNYFFYAEKKKQESIQIIAIWMYGKKYLVRVDPITTTPVLLFQGAYADGSRNISLAPGFGNEFLQVLPGSVTTKGAKISGHLKKMVRQSDLILIYLWKGKTWYFPVRKIKNLSPVASE